MRSKPPSTAEESKEAVHAPFSLYPTKFPKSCFNDAITLQPYFNSLVDAISRDSQFLESVMEPLAQSDSFISRCYQIYKTIKEEGLTQPINFGIHRSDYLLHKDVNGSVKIQQVELNTIAASFASLSTKVSEMHSHLSMRIGGPQFSDGTLVKNTAIDGLASGIAKAWELYGVKNSIIIMVVQDGERNLFDQRHLEFKLFERHGIKLSRMSLSRIASESRLVGPLRNNDDEVAVVYYRAGYGPGDYSQETDWSARLLLERSFAIKCPNIAYHLIGSKKIQQILAQPNCIERFLSNPSHSSAVRKSFTGLFPLDESEEGIAAYKAALQSPLRFVMKPQREGGGNNLYGEDMVQELLRLNAKERSAFILMELISGPTQRTTIIREGAPFIDDTVSELGIYGIWISDGPIIHRNEVSGYLLRTKSSRSHEGGVAAGYAVLDSILLV